MRAVVCWVPDARNHRPGDPVRRCSSAAQSCTSRNAVAAAPAPWNVRGTTDDVRGPWPASAAGPRRVAEPLGVGEVLGDCAVLAVGDGTVDAGEPLPLALPFAAGWPGPREQPARPPAAAAADRANSSRRVRDIPPTLSPGGETVVRTRRGMSDRADVRLVRLATARRFASPSRDQIAPTCPRMVATCRRIGEAATAAGS